MSKYSINLASALYTALAGVPSAQPAAVAGYWANREFFYEEFQHFLAVAKEYDDRRITMKEHTINTLLTMEALTTKQALAMLAGKSLRLLTSHGGEQQLQMFAQRWCH